MGHFMFCILHLLALVLVAPAFIFITVPLHIIYAAVSGGSSSNKGDSSENNS